MIKTRKNPFLFFVAIAFVSLFFAGVDMTKAGEPEYASCLLTCGGVLNFECNQQCSLLLGDGDGPGCGPNFTKVGGVCIPTNTGLPDPSGGIPGILKSIVLWLFGIFGVIALISFVISGIMYITSTGDTDQIEKAKRNAIYSIVGVIIGLSGFIIIKAVESALKGMSTF